MSNAVYLQGRKKYARPQALLFANNSGTLQAIEDGENEEFYHVPSGFDILSNPALNADGSQDVFMVLSDDNRSPLDFRINRIEKRERMINGRMRSYHITDKRTVTVSWDMLPSRAYSIFPNFNSSGNPTSVVSSVDHDNNPLTPNKPVVSLSGSPFYKDQQYTSDGGAGGVELLDWYEKNSGSFWVYLAYDKYNQFGDIQAGSANFLTLPKYNQVIEMFFSDFSYSVVKRGGSNYDFWNISLTLEEV